jgi:hypothetical protein
LTSHCFTNEMIQFKSSLGNQMIKSPSIIAE